MLSLSFPDFQEVFESTRKELRFVQGCLNAMLLETAAFPKATAEWSITRSRVRLTCTSFRRPTILKLTFWVCGTNSSTFKYKRFRSHQTSETHQILRPLRSPHCLRKTVQQSHHGENCNPHQGKGLEMIPGNPVKIDFGG